MVAILFGQALAPALPFRCCSVTKVLSFSPQPRALIGVPHTWQWKQVTPFKVATSLAALAQAT